MGVRGDRRRVMVAGAAVAALLLVALAGCQAPVAEPEPANVTVLNDSLSLDPGLTFARLEHLLAVNATAPDSVRVYDTVADYREARGLGNETEADVSQPLFLRHLGLDETTSPANSAITFEGRATSGGQLRLIPGANASDGLVHLLTAHELTHYITFQQGWHREAEAHLDLTTDASFVLQSLIEGSAIVTTDAYLERHVEGDRLNSPLYDRLLAETPPGHPTRYGHAVYVYGADYVADRVDRPAELSTVFETPPTTSEQVLHGFPPSEEPPVPLSVTVETGPAWRHVTGDTKGEALLRYALENGLEPERAAEAAAGWGNDTVEIFRSPSEDARVFAWVLRWDDAANASEFATAARDYLANRTRTRTEDGAYPIETGEASVTVANDRTTVLAFGDFRSLDALEVAADGASVTLSVAEESA